MTKADDSRESVIVRLGSASEHLARAAGILSDVAIEQPARGAAADPPPLANIALTIADPARKVAATAAALAGRAEAPAGVPRGTVKAD